MLIFGHVLIRILVVDCVVLSGGQVQCHSEKNPVFVYKAKTDGLADLGHLESFKILMLTSGPSGKRL